MNRSSPELSQTVVAPASPSGPGAIGVVQLAGPGAAEILERFFGGRVPEPSSRIAMGEFYDAERSVVDRVLVARLPVDEVIFEITSHGGVRIVQRILDTLEHAGAKLIAAVEMIPAIFKLDDVVSREAYRCLVEAKTTLAVKFLLHQAGGELAEVLGRRVEGELGEARRYWPAVEYLLKGATIVLAGPPNAGKSTLLNRVSRMDQALVADVAGTTRDYVEAEIDLEGLPVRLVDTAGLGRTRDPLYAQAARKALEQIAQADCVLLVLDATAKEASEEFLRQMRSVLVDRRVVVLINKTDCRDRSYEPSALLSERSWRVCEISALTGANVDLVPELVWEELGLKGFDYRRPTVFTSELAR